MPDDRLQRRPGSAEQIGPADDWPMREEVVEATTGPAGVVQRGGGGLTGVGAGSRVVAVARPELVVSSDLAPRAAQFDATVPDLSTAQRLAVGDLNTLIRQAGIRTKDGAQVGGETHVELSASVPNEAGRGWLRAWGVGLWRAQGSTSTPASVQLEPTDPAKWPSDAGFEVVMLGLTPGHAYGAELTVGGGLSPTQPTFHVEASDAVSALVKNTDWYQTIGVFMPGVANSTATIKVSGQNFLLWQFYRVRVTHLGKLG